MSSHPAEAGGAKPSGDPVARDADDGDPVECDRLASADAESDDIEASAVPLQCSPARTRISRQLRLGKNEKACHPAGGAR